MKYSCFVPGGRGPCSREVLLKTPSRSTTKCHENHIQIYSVGINNLYSRSGTELHAFNVCGVA